MLAVKTATPASNDVDILEVERSRGADVPNGLAIELPTHHCTSDEGFQREWRAFDKRYPVRAATVLPGSWYCGDFDFVVGIKKLVNLVPDCRREAKQRRSAAGWSVPMLIRMR